MYELKVKNGEVLKSIHDSSQAYVVIDGNEYDLEAIVNHFKKGNTNDSFVTTSDILDFESNIEMQRIVEESEEDIKHGRVYSSKEALDKIKNGEI